MAGCATEPAYQDPPLLYPKAPAKRRGVIAAKAFSPENYFPGYSLSAVLPEEEDTNSYFHLTFNWTYPYPQWVAYFRMWYGPAPGFYTNVTNLGATNSYYLLRTNWVEELERHFYVFSTVDKWGRESPYSTELHFPPFPDTHYTLSWTNPAPAIILGTTDAREVIDRWRVITNTVAGQTNLTAPMPSPNLVFILARPAGAPDLLSIRTFNPLN